MRLAAITLCFFLGLFLGLVSSGATDQDPTKVEPHLIGVGLVWQLEADNGFFSTYASACPIACGASRIAFLTAAHAVGSVGNEVTLTSQAGQALIAEVAAVHPECDLAYLIAELDLGESYSCIPLSTRGLIIREPVRTEGFSLGEVFTLYAGFAASQNRISCLMSRGCSGGAVLDSGGSLLGIMTGFSLDGEQWVSHLTALISIESIRPWLNEMIRLTITT